MRIHRPPDRFGLPPNYRWIHGLPPDPPIPVGITYTFSDYFVTEPPEPLMGARMCPDPKTKQ